VNAPRVREWRLRKGLTQDELAERSGIWRNTISDVESGKRKAHPRTLRMLAEGLGVPVEELAAPPSGLAQFLGVHVEALENIQETTKLIGELAGTPGEWEEMSSEERERRLHFLRRVAGLLRESTQTAASAAREALAIERGDPKEADEEEPPAKRNPGEDRLAALLSRMEATGTG
jgi:transcriptional regulator with XRE-family HTH domain